MNPTPALKRHALFFHRQGKARLTEFQRTRPSQRLEATVNPNNATAYKWIQALGFEFERNDDSGLAVFRMAPAATAAQPFENAQAERQLWAAVIGQAISVLKVKDDEIQADAREWFESNEYEVGSFLWACSQLDLNGDKVRQCVLADSNAAQSFRRTMQNARRDYGQEVCLLSS